MGRGNVYRETVAQMGKDGWLTLSWPEEFGGQGRPPMDGLIFNDEASIANVPVPFLTLRSGTQGAPACDPWLARLARLGRSSARYPIATTRIWIGQDYGVVEIKTDADVCFNFWQHSCCESALHFLSEFVLY